MSYCQDCADLLRQLKASQDAYEAEREFLRRIESALGADCHGSIGTGIMPAIERLKAQLLLVTGERDGERKRWALVRERALDLMNATPPTQLKGYHSIYYDGIADVMRVIDTVAGEAPEIDAAMAATGKGDTQKREEK